MAEAQEKHDKQLTDAQTQNRQLIEKEQQHAQQQQALQEKLADAQTQNQALTAQMAEQFRDSLNAFVDIAQRHRSAGDRTARIEHDMCQWLVEGLSAHGLDWPEDELTQWLQMDVKLNTQGLEYWLDHG